MASPASARAMRISVAFRFWRWSIRSVNSREKESAWKRAPRPSINRLPQPCWIRAVILLPAHLALGDRGEDRAVARQARAVNVARGVPQLRAQDRLGALEIDALDRNDDDRARRLAGEHEALA